MRDVKTRATRPWVTGDLVVARRLLDEVDEEARAAYARDEESCGFLVGPVADGRRLDGIVPMVNRANALHRLDPEQYPRTGRTYFDIDSMKFEARSAAATPRAGRSRCSTTRTSTSARTSRRPTRRSRRWGRASRRGTSRTW